MRVVLDECVPRPFGRELVGHDVTTVPRAGLAGVVNGELLRRLVGLCDAFVTVDRGIPNQQYLAGLAFGVVVIRARSNRLGDLLPLAADVLAALTDLEAGELRYVG